MRVDFGLILGVFLELLIILYYANTTLYPRKNYFQSITIATLGYITIFIISVFGRDLVNTASFFIVNFIILYAGYKINISNAFFQSAMLLIFCFVGEAVLSFLLELTFDVQDVLSISPAKSILLTIGGKAIYFIGILIITGMKRGKRILLENSFPVLILIPVITVVSIWAVIGVDIDNRIFIVLCMVFTFANIMTFALNEFIISKNTHIKRLELENSKNQIALEEYRHLNQAYEENRLFRHDLKEHLSVLRALLRDDKTAALQYMQKLDDMSDRMKYEQYSGNAILNILLIQKSRECREKNISLHIQSTDPNLNFIDDMDIVTIFSNLLNNAIEACEQTDEKKISLEIAKGNRAFVVIKLENSSNSEPVTAHGVLVTSKNNSRDHGMGARSIKNALKKYNGQIDWKYDKTEKTFRTIVILNSADI